MAITYTISSLKPMVWGAQRVRMATITLTGTYVAGGFTLTPADFGLREIEAAIVLGTTGNKIFNVSAAAGVVKVVAMKVSAAAASAVAAVNQVSAGTSLTGGRLQVIAIGNGG